jgi:hypothetical protein
MYNILYLFSKFSFFILFPPHCITKGANPNQSNRFSETPYSIFGINLYPSLSSSQLEKNLGGLRKARALYDNWDRRRHVARVLYESGFIFRLIFSVFLKYL